jgi:hypothetical protein
MRTRIPSQSKLVWEVQIGYYHARRMVIQVAGRKGVLCRVAREILVCFKGVYRSSLSASQTCSGCQNRQPTRTRCSARQISQRRNAAESGVGTLVDGVSCIMSDLPCPLLPEKVIERSVISSEKKRTPEVGSCRPNQRSLHVERISYKV